MLCCSEEAAQAKPPAAELSRHTGYGIPADKQPYTEVAHGGGHRDREPEGYVESAGKLWGPCQSCFEKLVIILKRTLRSIRTAILPCSFNYLAKAPFGFSVSIDPGPHTSTPKNWSSDGQLPIRIGAWIL